MQTDDQDSSQGGPGLGPGQKGKSRPRLVACRECHRSKLKCDRSYPCKSCIKRGCADICPDGTLVATKRQKSAIEASQLREKTALMAERIRALENALAIAHSKTTSETHPFLANTDVENRMNTSGSVDRDRDSGGDSDVIDAFGTLSIGQDGRSRYHNQSAGADYFAEAEAPEVPTAGALAFPPESASFPVLPPEILHLAALFPFGPAENDEPPCEIEALLAQLPSAEEGWRISQIFFEHGEWLFDAVSRAEFNEEIFPAIYAPDPELELDSGLNAGSLDDSDLQEYAQSNDRSRYIPPFPSTQFPTNATFTSGDLPSLNTFPPRPTTTQPFPGSISQPLSSTLPASQLPTTQTPNFPAQPPHANSDGPFSAAQPHLTDARAQIHPPVAHASPEAILTLSDSCPSSSPPLAILSLFFIILAIGTLLDTSRPYDIRATEPWYQLARAAFCLGEGNGYRGASGIEGGARGCLESLHFQIIYLYMTDRQSVEHRWLNMGLLAKLTYSTGLHRDSSYWIRDNQREIERRRKLFWEIYAYDAWISFIMGRPPSFNLAHIQCSLPKDLSYINENGVAEPSFHKFWKYTYRTQCLVPIVEEAFGAKSPSYATILRLDRKIRDFEAPESLQLVGGSGGGVSIGMNGMGISLSKETRMNMGAEIGAGLGLEMQRYMLFCERETSLLYLHRTYFAQAVCDCPENPLESKYATSVSAAYRSACLIVAGTHDATVRHPELAARFWFFWSNLFSAAIVLGTIVTRSPACQLSVTAMTELDLACNLMENRAAPGRSAKAVPILRRLRDKARNTLAHVSQGGTMGIMDKASPSSNNSTSTKNDEYDELAIYVGRTRFISNTARTNSRSPTRSPHGVNPRIASPRRRGSEGARPPCIRGKGRGGSEDRRESEQFAGIGVGGYAEMQDTEIFKQAHPSLLEYTKGIPGYIPPPAIMRSIIAAREEIKDGRNESGSASNPNANGQGNGARQPHSPEQQPRQVYSWETSAPAYMGQIYDQHPGAGGMYAPGMLPNPQVGMAQALGTFPYPAELNSDGTWQQLMEQLGVMEGGA